MERWQHPCAAWCMLTVLWHQGVSMLDRLSVIWLNPTSCTQGQMAQWLEHPVYIWEVLGSNPSLVIFLIAPTCCPSKGGPSYGLPLLRSLWVAFLTQYWSSSDKAVKIRQSEASICAYLTPPRGFKF